MSESDYTAEFADGDQRSFGYLLNPLDVSEDTRSTVASPRESTERERRERERERSGKRFRSVPAFSRWKLMDSLWLPKRR